MKVLTFVFFAALSAHADSIGTTYALQANGSVPLGGSPPLLLTQGVPGWRYLIFASILPPMQGPVTFGVTVGSFTFSAPFLVNCVGQSQCFTDQGFIFPVGFYRPVNGVLTVSFEGQTHEYAFQMIEPVPEPATLALVGTGLAAIVRKKLRSRVKYSLTRNLQAG